jgi:hypothetical protein
VGDTATSTKFAPGITTVVVTAFVEVEKRWIVPSVVTRYPEPRQVVAEAVAAEAGAVSASVAVMATASIARIRTRSMCPLYA